MEYIRKVITHQNWLSAEADFNSGTVSHREKPFIEVLECHSGLDGIGFSFLQKSLRAWVVHRQSHKRGDPANCFRSGRRLLALPGFGYVFHQDFKFFLNRKKRLSYPY